MNRRKFLSTSGMFVLLGSLLSSIGCPGGSSMFQKIFDYATLGLQAFQAILNILSGTNIIPTPLTGTLFTVATLVKAGFGDLQIIVKEYEAAPADQKDTMVHKVSLVLGEIEAHVTEFWSGLNIPDQKLSGLIQSLVVLIISTIRGFQSQLPGGAAKQLPAHPKLGNVQPKARSTKEFKDEFNQLLEQNGYSQNKVH